MHNVNILHTDIVTKFYVKVNFCRKMKKLILSAIKGNLGLPNLNSILFKAALTGIGLTLENKSFIKGIDSSCIFFDFSIFPLKNSKSYHE